MRRAVPPPLAVGQVRTVRKFLLFPKTLTTERGVSEWRWLESASVRQVVQKKYIGSRWYLDWVEVSWAD